MNRKSMDMTEKTLEVSSLPPSSNNLAKLVRARINKGQEACQDYSKWKSLISTYP